MPARTSTRLDAPPLSRAPSFPNLQPLGTRPGEGQAGQHRPRATLSPEPTAQVILGISQSRVATVTGPHRNTRKLFISHNFKVLICVIKPKKSELATNTRNPMLTQRTPHVSRALGELAGLGRQAFKRRTYSSEQQNIFVLTIRVKEVLKCITCSSTFFNKGQCTQMMAHGQHCTVVYVVHQIFTGALLGDRHGTRWWDLQAHSSRVFRTHSRALGQLFSNCSASLLLLGITFDNFLAYFLTFRLPAVPSS